MEGHADYIQTGEERDKDEEQNDKMTRYKKQDLRKWTKEIDTEDCVKWKSQSHAVNFAPKQEYYWEEEKEEIEVYMKICQIFLICRH